MKFILITLLFLEAHFLLAQQNYLPLVSPQNEWVVDFVHPSPGWPMYIQRYTFDADSVLLNGKYYHELIYSNSMSGGPWVGDGTFFREAEGRIFRLFGNLPEQLIYDFNMGIGDSLPGFGPTQATRYVKEVEAITLLDGTPRKRIILESVCGESDWIEGAGQLDDLFYSWNFCTTADGTHYYIRCFSTNGELLYLRPDLSGCYTTSTTNLAQGKVLVFPNPTSDVLTIQLDDNQTITQVFLYNSLGQKVLSQSEFATQGDIRLSVRGLPSGCYTGTLFFEGNTLGVFKVAVKNW